MIWSELHGNVQKAGSSAPGRNTTDGKKAINSNFYATGEVLNV